VAGGNKTSNARVFKEIMGEDFDYLAFRQRTMDLFDEHVEKYGIDIKPHVEDTLRFLKEHGVKIALATSTARTRAQQRLDSVGIAGYFDEKVCGDEITHGKPEPDIYLKACGKLGVNPDEAVAVEDSVNGIISASRAGLCTVMVVDLIKPNDITRERAYKTFCDIEDICSLFE
jgi:HAD superfamily hydrolase (TIGR01509 family)